MSRLVHSEAGLIRSLQISRNNFFAFVEGGLDRTFCDRMLEHFFSGSAVKHEVMAARELPGATGGKAPLLSFFDKMRRRGQLSGEAFGKKFVCLFFADKDIDDVRRRQLKSPHLIYTPTYDLEGHLFTCGDLARAVADACGLTVAQAKALIGDQTVWIGEQVENWRSWIVLCMISQVKAINCGCTYERPSSINPNLIDPADEEKLREFKDILRQKLQMSADDFNALYESYEIKVAASVAQRAPLKLFKGKWLKPVLEMHLKRRNVVADVNLGGAGERVAATLVAQVGSRGPCGCSSRFEAGVRRLAGDFL